LSAVADGYCARAADIGVVAKRNAVGAVGGDLGLIADRDGIG